MPGKDSFAPWPAVPAAPGPGGASEPDVEEPAAPGPGGASEPDVEEPAAPIVPDGALLGGDRGRHHLRALVAYRFNAGEGRGQDSAAAYRHDRARVHYDRALCLYRFDAARAHSSPALCAYQYEPFRS